MKKLVLVFFALCISSVVSAQIEKGTILLNGSSNLNFTSYNEDAGDYSNFNLNVKGGYFIMDNLVLGLKLGYDKTNLNYDGAPSTDATTQFGVFGRYYVNGKILLGLGFVSEDDGTNSGSAIQFEGGYAIFLNNAVAIEPALNFNSYGGDYDGSSFGLNVGISVFLGRGE